MKRSIVMVGVGSVLALSPFHALAWDDGSGRICTAEGTIIVIPSESAWHNYLDTHPGSKPYHEGVVCVPPTTTTKPTTPTTVAPTTVVVTAPPTTLAPTTVASTESTTLSATSEVSTTVAPVAAAPAGTTTTAAPVAAAAAPAARATLPSTGPSPYGPIMVLLGAMSVAIGFMFLRGARR